MPGWIANYRETIEDRSARIYRPRQIYQGAPLVHYTPISERE
jgi:citrate synthase